MSSETEQESPVGIIAQGSLGPGNRGNIGPTTDTETAYADDLGNNEYQLPARDESHCMDDRLEVYGVQLAGNRAVTETGGSLMEPEGGSRTLSERFGQSVKELLDKGKTPCFHPGCAALLLLSNRQAAEYLADTQNQPLITGLSDNRMRLLGIDTLSPNDYQNAYETVTDTAADKDFWDADADKLLELAKSLGAPVDTIEGEHSSCATRWDMSEKIFDNGTFRQSHKDENGQPMGALSVTMGAYKKQLEDEGLESQAVSQKVMRAMLFNIAVLKLAQKEGAPDVIIGNTLVVD